VAECTARRLSTRLSNSNFPVFNSGFGNNTITNFNPGHDVIQFNHALFTNFAAVMAHTQRVGANTLITYDANDEITLKGVTASSLHSSNFKFV
jgi:hypothetical protein